MKSRLWFLTMLGLVLGAITFFFRPLTTQADISGVTVTPLIEDDSSGVTDRFQIVGKSNEERTVKISLGNFSINRYTLVLVPTNATTSWTVRLPSTIKLNQDNLG
ncbi:hypothetical protein [Companilactobacillus sp. FL22-1]|uniref:hypothetical protein n=1 Tax=Companilactobacillus sp. FL22-1 TaxID=3373892 RepID=UPI003754EE19